MRDAASFVSVNRECLKTCKFACIRVTVCMLLAQEYVLSDSVCVCVCVLILALLVCNSLEGIHTASTSTVKCQGKSRKTNLSIWYTIKAFLSGSNADMLHACHHLRRAQILGPLYPSRCLHLSHAPFRPSRSRAPSRARTRWLSLARLFLFSTKKPRTEEMNQTLPQAG